MRPADDRSGTNFPISVSDTTLAAGFARTNTPTRNAIPRADLSNGPKTMTVPAVQVSSSQEKRLNVMPVVFTQDGAVPQQKSRKDKTASRALRLLEEVRDSQEPRALAWNNAFKGKTFSPKVLSIAFSYLHDKKLYEDAVEGIQAAIRNDHAQPWMYDVLAIEMKLAKRPQKDIDRVLLSRIDFAPGNQAQMLVTASTLAGFDAFEQAIGICREAAKRTPWEPTVWSTARRIADQSKDPESILWSRTGTIRHVWTDDYETLHEVCKVTLEDLQRQLNSDAQPQLASRVREQNLSAQQRDIRISIHWNGDADLDLSVKEPGGRICSRKIPLTANGGLLIKQSSGGKANRGIHTEEYVCPVAPSGEYVVTVRYIHGRVLRGAVNIKQVRYQNTDRELKTEVFEKGIVDDDVQIKIQLNHGRSKQ